MLLYVLKVISFVCFVYSDLGIKISTGFFTSLYNFSTIYCANGVSWVVKVCSYTYYSTVDMFLGHPFFLSPLRMQVI